jgi:hypothetical protein
MAVDYFSIDPLTYGAQIEIRNAAGIPKFRVTLPPGSDPWSQLRPGWDYFLNDFTFADFSPGGTGAVNAMYVMPYLGAGSVDVRIMGAGGTIAIGPSDLPLALTVVLGDGAAGDAGACGEIRFDICKTSRTTIKCKLDPFLHKRS